MSDMVQRVAAAILLEQHREWLFDAALDDIVKTLGKRNMAISRAAIDAMREPTVGMVSSIKDFDIYWGYLADGRPCTPETVWQAMIDAALAEKS